MPTIILLVFPITIPRMAIIIPVLIAATIIIITTDVLIATIITTDLSTAMVITREGEARRSRRLPGAPSSIHM
jgi:hypothetical protein